MVSHRLTWPEVKYGGDGRDGSSGDGRQEGGDTEFPLAWAGQGKERESTKRISERWTGFLIKTPNQHDENVAVGDAGWNL